MEKTFELDLTPMMWCHRREDLRNRERVAEEYSAKVQGKLKKSAVRKMQITETIIILIPTLYLFGRIFL